MNPQQHQSQQQQPHSGTGYDPNNPHGGNQQHGNQQHGGQTYQGSRGGTHNQQGWKQSPSGGPDAHRKGKGKGGKGKGKNNFNNKGGGRIFFLDKFGTVWHHRPLWSTYNHSILMSAEHSFMMPSVVGWLMIVDTEEQDIVF